MTERVVRSALVACMAAMIVLPMIWLHILIARHEKQLETLNKIMAEHMVSHKQGTVMLDVPARLVNDYTLATSGIRLEINQGHQHFEHPVIGKQQSYLVAGLNHVCIESDFATKTMVICLPASKPKAHWMHAFPSPQRNTFSGVVNGCIVSGYGEWVVEHRIAAEYRDLAYAQYFIYWLLQRGTDYWDQFKQEQAKHQAWASWRAWHTAACVLFPLLGVYLVWSLGLLHRSFMQTVRHEARGDQPLAESFVQSLIEKYRIDWLIGKNERHLINAIRTDCEKERRRRRNQAKRNRLRELVGEEQAQRIEARHRRKNKRDRRSERRSASGRMLRAESDSCEEALTTEIRELIGSGIFDDSDADIEHEAPENDDFDEAAKPNRARLAMLASVQACSHDLEIPDTFDEDDLDLLAAYLRTMKRVITREQWAGFIEDFDAESEETWRPPIELCLKGDHEGLRRYFDDSDERRRKAEAEPLAITPMLKGKSVLIVGGLNRLGVFYTEQVQRLGAATVQYRHHSEHRRMNDLKPEVILYLHRHSSHSAQDKIRTLGGRIIMVRYYQKSSFLRGLIKDLEEQL